MSDKLIKLIVTVKSSVQEQFESLCAEWFEKDYRLLHINSQYFDALGRVM